MIYIPVKNYVITADERNFTVKKIVSTKTNPETGEEENGLTLVGYFRTMKMALVAIKKNMVLSGDEEIRTVKEYITALGYAEQEINTILDKVEEETK